MAKRKEGHRVLFLELPDGLKERLRAIARGSRRSMVAEAQVAIERHIAIEEEALRRIGIGPKLHTAPAPSQEDPHAEFSEYDDGSY